MPSFRASQAALSLILAAACAAAAPGARAADPPNILLIIADDHSPALFGAYGSAKAKTPNLDKFAASGMKFTRAFANSPAGQPSRLSMLAGRLPHSIGVTMNDYQERKDEGDWNHDRVTMADFLGFLGHRTFASGSMYFANEDARYGFGMTFTFHDAQVQLEERGAKPPPDGLAAADAVFRPFVDPPRVWLNSANLPMGYYAEDFPDAAFIQRAADFMGARRADPFFCAVGFMEPKAPFAYPIEFAGTFRAEEFEAPKVAPEERDEQPSVFANLTESERRGSIAACFTASAYLDQSVGNLLDKLEKSGAAGQTVVIYVSDSGCMLGEHGWFEKHCLYDPAIRVPLVIRWPGVTRPGSTCDELVELIDLFPTIAEMCGARIPPTAEGASLAPLLRGDANARGRSAIFSEYLDTEEATIREGRYKLVYRTGNRTRSDGFVNSTRPKPPRAERLYDLQADPGETKNLAGDPAQRGRVEGMKQEMARRLRSGLPSGIGLPTAATLDEQLDLLLIPRELWERVDRMLRQER